MIVKYVIQAIYKLEKSIITALTLALIDTFLNDS